MVEHLGSVFYRRALEGGDETVKYDMPAWALLVFLADFIIFLPLFVILNYTISCLYPIFAMVEDENPPAYEPVSLGGDDDANTGDHRIGGSKPTNGQAKTVTSSLRAINRLLRSTGGFKANFRGLFCALAQTLLIVILMGIFSGLLGGPFTPIATLLATLALVQYSAAWVHIVISNPSPLHFWQRLPPFKRTFEATWKAVTLNWFAVEVTRWIPTVMAAVLGLDVPDFKPGQPTDVSDVDSVTMWKGVVVLVVSVTCSIFLVIPAQIILVRVQASLLPVQEDAIIPFDRSFEGKVEPAIVGGLGYATISDAWSTFSRAGWRRMLVLYAKIFMLHVAFGVVLVLVLVPEIIMIAKKTTKVHN